MAGVSGWDDIIVGAGSCGAVLASRLTEDPGRRVLLLEAGPDFPGPLPRELEDARVPVFSGYHWDYYARQRSGGLGSAARQSLRAYAGAPTRDLLSAASVALRSPRAVSDALMQFPYFVGKLVGGSSAINGALALRGAPQDFEAWAAAGNPLWSWDEVLPHFVAVESDHDFSEKHGKEGPVPIRRPAASELTPFHAAVLAGCSQGGMAQVADLNSEPQVGIGPLPTNTTREHQRVSSATAYLPRARARAHLEIRSGALVDRVVFEGRRAIGVDLVVGGARQRVHSDRVTLCAGAVNTPAILQRSGIGSAERCRPLGVGVVAELDGVGEGLMDHPAVVLWSTPRPGVCRDGDPFHQVMGRIASQPGGFTDLSLFPIGNVRTEKLPMLSSLLRSPWAQGISVMVNCPEARGRTFVERADPDCRPTIELNFCSSQKDLDRLMFGVRYAWRLLNTPVVRKQIDRPFIWTDRLIASDDLLRSAITTFVGSAWHACSTARMGPDGDPGAVVDQRCRVRGMEGLAVVDASVMPSIPSAPLGLTCFMLAERVAQWMRQ